MKMTTKIKLTKKARDFFVQKMRRYKRFERVALICAACYFTFHLIVAVTRFMLHAIGA